MIAGPSGSGKTQLVEDLLTEKRVPQRQPTEHVLLRGMATPLHPYEEKWGSISSRDSHLVSIRNVVPRPGKGSPGLGRSHGKRGQ